MSKVSSNEVDVFAVDLRSELSLPFADGGIRAGFPSPAQDYMEMAIDLNKELVAHPSSTFYGRVKGTSMCDAGVDEDDILVIDRSLEPTDGDMAVCYIDGEFTLKYIQTEPNALWLIPANKDFSPVKVTADNHFIIWGVVTYIIKNNRRRRK